MIETASIYLLETGNATLMPVIQAFQAEIALRQGQIAGPANGRLISIRSPLDTYGRTFFAPFNTGQNLVGPRYPASRQQAADLLEQPESLLKSPTTPAF